MDDDLIDILLDSQQQANPGAVIADGDVTGWLQRIATLDGNPSGNNIDIDSDLASDNDTRHDAGAPRQLEIRHLKTLLRYAAPENAEAARMLERALGLSEPPKNIATPEELRRLLALPAPKPSSSMSDALRALITSLARRSRGGYLRWRSTPLGERDRAGWYQHLLHAILEAVPGQPLAARAIARSLALQLTDPTRSLPVFAFLSGPLGSGSRQAASAVAKALASCNYGTLEVEMSQIRCEEEASEIDGSQPYWRGARPGKVTSAVHRCAKTVVVLHDVDRTLAGVQASLLPALRDGILVDNYGLSDMSSILRREDNERLPSTVDMKQAVLLLTASHGHEVWSLPDLAELMDAEHDEQLNDVREMVLGSLRHGVRQHRGSEQRLFDHGLLARLEGKMVLFKPARWEMLRKQASRAVQDACRASGRRLDLQLDLDEATAQALAVAYLAGLGGRASLDRVSVQELECSLLGPLDKALIEHELARHRAPRDDTAHATKSPSVVKVLMPTKAVEAMEALLRPYMPEPQTNLQRRRLALRFDTGLDTEASPWTLRFEQPRLVQTKASADYTGELALSAVVPNLSFDDIAGQDQAKQHLMQVIDVYARADSLRARGVELPRGAVLHGPPGTGKTLLAQAMAAQAGMAFIATSGTELLHTERARTVFALARRAAPAIVFIDEADALGKRGQTSGAHDAAITQLLTAIQGFDQRAPVFILAASNRPKLLDPALTRPGRLERAIYVGPLDRKGREPLVDKLLALLSAEERARPEGRERLLAFSHGMTGADLSQVLREAGLANVLSSSSTATSTSASAPTSTLHELLEAILECKYGSKTDGGRRKRLRERVAFHEAGHAVLHALWWPEIPIEQVTITARGDAEGFMAFNAEDALPIAETPRALRRHIGVLLGGRMAEVLRYGREEGVASGCRDDLVRARTAAFVAVAHHGLDDSFGLLSLAQADTEDRALMPESLKQEVFTRVREWLALAGKDAMATLQQHWCAVQQLAAELLEHEYVPGARVEAILHQQASLGFAVDPIDAEDTFESAEAAARLEVEAEEPVEASP